MWRFFNIFMNGCMREMRTKVRNDGGVGWAVEAYLFVDVTVA